MPHTLMAAQKVVDGTEFWDLTFGGFRLTEPGNSNGFEPGFLYELQDLKFKVNKNTGEMTLRHKKEPEAGETGQRTRSSTGMEFRGSAPPLALIQRILYRVRKIYNDVTVSTSSHVDSQTGLATFIWTIAN